MDEEEAVQSGADHWSVEAFAGVRDREERFKATGPDQAWSIDFVADQLQDGTRFRSLTMVDIYAREGVTIEVGHSLKGDDVVRTLNRLKQERGVPKLLFCDYGSEFTSQAMDLWAIGMD